MNNKYAKQHKYWLSLARVRLPKSKHNSLNTELWLEEISKSHSSVAASWIKALNPVMDVTAILQSSHSWFWEGLEAGHCSQI